MRVSTESNAFHVNLPRLTPGREEAVGPAPVHDDGVDEDGENRRASAHKTSSIPYQNVGSISVKRLWHTNARQMRRSRVLGREC